MTVDHNAFVLGGSGGLRARERGAVRAWTGIGIIAMIVALPLRGLYHATGGTLEEAFMLYFPARMRKGDIPNVDFLHLYGPGALHVLVGWYELFGNSLFAERTFGLLQHLGIIAGLYTLARPWGRRAATAVGVFAVFYVLMPIGLIAMAWNGGLALTLWTAVFIVRSQHVDGRRHTTSLVVAGLLAGLALTYRPDLVVALGALCAWLVWTRRDRLRSQLPPIAAGVAVGLVPIWVHLVMAGPTASWRGMVTDPVFHLRAGRELPSPPSWGHLDGALQRIAETKPTPWWHLPQFAASNAIFLWFFAMVLGATGLLAFAIWQRRGGRVDGRSTTLLVVAIVSIGILPQGLQRPDSTHLTWVTCIPFPFLVVIGAEATRRVLPDRHLRFGLRVGAAAAVVVTFALTSLFTLRYYVLHTRVSVGAVREPFEIGRGWPRPDGTEGDYRFYFGSPRAARASQAVVNDLAEWSTPGERLFVGPMDLSRTWYNDVVFYWMFPELEPATYFVEMDPGLANAPGSRMANDLRTADWVILTAFWQGWDEPNDSMKFGDPTSNAVIASDFRLFREYEGGLVRLYYHA